MKYKVLILFLLSISIYAEVCQSQVVVKGYLQDSLNKTPIANAHIVASDNSSCITGDKGYFKLTTKSLPIVLKISHVSYGVNEILIKSVPKTEDLIIRLAPNIQRINEVQISGRRLRVLTRDEDFNIADMAFDANHLWMIIFNNNNKNESLLCLANSYGDTISSIKIGYPARLYKDVFDNVHLETRDSVFQLYALNNQTICCLHGEEQEVFHQVVDQFVEGFAGKLVYAIQNQYAEKVIIGYIDSSKAAGNYLTQVFDSLEFCRKEYERKTGNSMWQELMKSRYWKKNTKLAQIYEAFVKAPLFSLNDTLYIVNTYKDSLLSFTPEGTFARAIPIQFHKDTVFWSIDYKEIQFLTDNSTHSCYILERWDAGWAIQKLNINTGQVERRIALPNYPGMTRIAVFKNAIYFLYNEKNYPYYVRLFRYQLDS